ncbi:FAD-dependent monooxygenase [Rhodobaculum claviforme]|uniref:2-octaprenyl-6-methoxyphenyl hydroxylase n=1 Tax=Rhodobaculum claviforme TaxID=1549854 RepID=A0A934TJ03_9RHOB|nr:FAD-dependent monooxygenase [Rhodobaculum claviforme]MBK5926391.1 2-octaprenyl-6-methoxyphenyl hydroxylase [Rhodobaculum claviforme]
MEHDADVLIVGGGLNGPLLALALARAGLRVTVIDALPAGVRGDPGFDGRAYAMALASVRMLRAMGLWAGLEADAEPILRVRAADGRVGEAPSALHLSLDHAEIEEGPLGAMVEDRHLRRALMDAMAAEPGITHRAGARVVAQAADATGVRVTLAGGETVRGALLVGCDGRDSGTARRAGIRRVHWRYGQTALVCAVEHTRPHNGVAQQLFLPGGPLAMLPLTHNRSSIVWSEATAVAAAIAGLDEAGYRAALTLRLGDALGEVGLVGRRWSYPLGLSLANRFVDARLALVGDAAHGIHPIAGQGLNLGLRDVAALAEVLVDALRRGEDIAAPAVLARYQVWRRFDATAMALATDTFNRVFSNDNGVLRGLRDIGLGVAGAVPTLRRAFMRQAAGLTGEVPRLMQGRPL